VPGGPTRTAISISGPAARVTPELVARAVPVLLAVADEFAAELSD
jgi:IclR family transcriptional regulator, acetate operon repressor